MVATACWVHPDLFAVDGDAKHALLYAPLHGVAMLVSPSTIPWLEKVRATGHLDLEAGAEVARHLTSLGLLSTRPFESDVRRPAACEPYRPTAVTLFLTSRCNLRCGYCYARGGERPRTMPLPVARDAVDLVLSNAAETGSSNATIGFHGGGEPTRRRALMARIAEHARAGASSRGLAARLTLGTNGVMAEQDAAWVASAMDSATLSIDGPPDIQDRQRPNRSGAPSSACVQRTMRTFDAAGLSYQLRATVTAESVDRLPDIVRFCAASCRSRRLKVEPLFVVGRAEDRALCPPEPLAFVDAFCRAADVAAEVGMDLSYSGIRVDTVTDRFCGAGGGLFGVTHEGNVSACYEVTDGGDPRAERFFFGVHVPGKGFRFDLDRIRALGSLSVHDAAACHGCFARWHCAGDCPAKVLLASSLTGAGPNHRSWRCEITRELTRRRLMALAIGSENLLAAQVA